MMTFEELLASFDIICRAAPGYLGDETKTNKPVSISKASKTLGLYILGTTGMGKSSLLEDLIVQDIRNRIGCMFLDPHQDPINHIIGRLTEEQLERVVLLDISDPEYAFGINPFACANPQSRFAVSDTVERVVHLFESLYGSAFEMTNIWSFLRNAAIAFTTRPGSTMRDVRILLQPRIYPGEWHEFVEPLKTSFPLSYDFWHEYAALTQFRQEEIRRSTLTRVDAFSDPMVYDVVNQVEPRFSLSQMMRENKAVLVKLDRRKPLATKLIGALLIASLMEAAVSRMGEPEDSRQAFHLYADEFPTYATLDFADLFTQPRKYGINTTASHQDRGQIRHWNDRVGNELLSATMGAGNRVMFRLEPADAQEIAPTFDTYREGPAIRQVKTRPVTADWKQAVWNSPGDADECGRIDEQVAFLRKQGHIIGHIAGYGCVQDVDSLLDTFWDLIKYPSQQDSNATHWSQQIRDNPTWCRYRDKEEPAQALYQSFKQHSGNPGRVVADKIEEIIDGIPRLTKRAELLRSQIRWIEHSEYLYDEPVTTSFVRGSTMRGEDIMGDRTQYEWIPGPPRPRSDVAAEIANELTRMDQFVCRARVQEGQKATDYIIRRKRPPEGITSPELEGRIRYLTTWSRLNYCRPRTEIVSPLDSDIPIQTPVARRDAPPPMRER